MSEPRPDSAKKPKNLQPTEANTYLAVLGDLVGSRHLDPQVRGEVQERILHLIENWNASQRVETYLALPVELTAGDEVQALFGDPLRGANRNQPPSWRAAREACEAVIELMVELADTAHPALFAFGLGVGRLSVPLTPRRRVSHADGPCFQDARAAVSHARARGRWAWLEAAGATPPARVLNALFALTGEIRGRWSETQQRYVRAFRTGALQSEVAERFEVVPSTVSEALKAARFERVREAEGALAFQLAEVLCEARGLSWRLEE